MSYLALYRKYRPNTFSSVIGQPHITNTLKNQLQTEKISHAYLFCGTRGTGKTSTAKILARAINCEHKTEDGEPCNACDMCLSILNNTSMNVFELDAASYNKTDDIKDLKETIHYPPTEGFYKVYIIDEVHMLTNTAFNALLKTLEEPPEHVIFILATTDPQKIIATILSRCQRFDFRRITTKNIVDTLQGFLSQEEESITEDALFYIAQLGDGSMRDSLSILDQCLAVYRNETITYENVLYLLGAVDRTILFTLTQSLSQRNTQAVMQIVEQIMSTGRDIQQFINEYILHLRNFLMITSLKDVSHITDISQEEKEKFQQLHSFLSKEEIFFFIEEFCKLQTDLKYSLNHRITLEIALLRFCTESLRQDNTALLARFQHLERKIEQGIPTAPSPPPLSSPFLEKPKPKEKRIPRALGKDMQNLQKNWASIRTKIKKSGLQTMLLQSDIFFKEDGKVYISCENPVELQYFKHHEELIKTILEAEIQKEISLGFVRRDEYERWYQRTYDISYQEYQKSFTNTMIDLLPDLKTFQSVTEEVKEDSSDVVAPAELNSSDVVVQVELDSSDVVVQVELDSSDTVAQVELDSSDVVVQVELDSSDLVTPAELNSSDVVVQMELDSSDTVSQTELDSSDIVAPAELDSSDVVAPAELDSPDVVAQVELDSPIPQSHFDEFISDVDCDAESHAFYSINTSSLFEEEDYSNFHQSDCQGMISDYPDDDNF